MIGLKHTTLEEDERYDTELLREILNKERNFIKAATWLSEKFSYRYGTDFGGRVDVRYNLVEKVFTVKCSDGSSFILDHDKLYEFPAYMRILRLRAKRNKKGITN